MTPGRPSEVVEVHPASADDFDAWFDVMSSAAREGRPAPLVWEREDLRALLVRDAGATHRLWAARVAGDVVGTLLLEEIGTDSADVDVNVAVTHRRHGVGRRLWRVASDLLADRGPVRVEAGVNVVDAGTPGVGFAAALGFVAVHDEQHLALALPVTDEVMEVTIRPTAEHHLVSWQDRAPDDLVDAYAACRTAMSRDVPTGESRRDAEVWDVARVRESEDRAAEQGRTTLVTAVLTPARELVGYTVLAVPSSGPDVYQGDTWVRHDHRGSGLGGILKVENLRRLGPRTGWVHTWTDELNSPMAALNHRLGFRVVEVYRELERDLP